MRRIFIALLLCVTTWCCGQDPDTLQYIPLDTMESDTVPFRYPYMGPRVPPWMGVVVGYEGWQLHCWETGLIFNLGEYYDHEGHARGVTIGGAMTYKQSFSGRLKTAELEIGLYAPVSLGFGFNENFYEGSRTFGFRPFLGTSWFHFQLLAGYNFYSKKKSNIADLNNFTLKVRYAIPVRRLYKGVTPNPGNNY